MHTVIYKLRLMRGTLVAIMFRALLLFLLAVSCSVAFHFPRLHLKHPTSCASAEGVQGTCRQWLDCMQIGGRFGGYCNMTPESTCCLNNEMETTAFETCSVSTHSDHSIFANPSYPKEEQEGRVCVHRVHARMDTCAMRVDIESAFLHRQGKYCTSNSITIGSGEGRASTSLCGLLKRYSMVVPAQAGESVKIVAMGLERGSYWYATVTQIKCSEVHPPANSDCGISTYPVMPLSAASVSAIPTTAISPLAFVQKSGGMLEHENCDVRRILESNLLSMEGIGRLKIVNGNETLLHEFPWQAALMLNERFYCGGSLISPQWVITAAHCVDLHPQIPMVDIMTVRLGDHDLSTSSEGNHVTRRVSRVVLHPEFQTQDRIINDLALLLLDRPVQITDSVRPVCLPSSDYEYSGQRAVAVGWGRTEEGVVSNRLRKAVLPIVSFPDCLKRWSSNLVQEGMICAGGGESGVCNGDSGGPLLINKDGRYYLEGIVSFGTIRGCAVPDMPSVFTRVPAYRDWISMALAH